MRSPLYAAVVLLAATVLPSHAFLSPFTQAPSKARTTQVVVYSDPMPPKNDIWGLAKAFYNELVPWGDPSKGLTNIVDKRNAMVVKYMEKTGCSKEEAQKEVDGYLADKEGYVKRKRAEEAAEAAAKGKKQ